MHEYGGEGYPYPYPYPTPTPPLPLTKARWKRCMGMVEEALGEAVGQLYVAQYFNAEAKQRALTMVEQVRQA